jgi:sodium transport system permease protein
MNWKNVATVYRKELRDLLRDRRTLISMIVIPTFLMPALMFGIGFLSVKVFRQAQATVPTIMLIGGADSPKIHAALASNAKVKIIPTEPTWKELIGEKKVRAAVEVPAGFDAALERGEPAEVKIYTYEGEMRSGMAAGELRRFFSDYRDKEIADRLAHRGLSATLIKPFEVKSENVAPSEKVGGNLFGGIIPYFFLLLAFSGALYPAMDLTAGEKERGTLETILCSPLARVDLVLGKFFMVLTASLSTVVISLLSMGTSLMIGGMAFGSSAAGSGVARKGVSAISLPSFDPAGLLAVIAMVLPMAVLFAAGLIAVSLFAKSFKEAQSYASPLIMVIIMPAVIGMLPGVDLNSRLALVPILNVSLVSKELVSGTWHWNYIALIFGSSCVYAAIALALAVKMFNRETVIFRT